MSRIVVVGGVNMDLHLFDVEPSAGQAPLVAGHYLAQPGGKGANVARAVAHLGAEVHLVACVGDDEFGRDCVRTIADDGVDTRHVTTTGDAPTGFVAIELRQGRHRSLLFAPGANDALTWSATEPAIADLGPDDVVIAQAEVPGDVLVPLARVTSRIGAALFLDPTPPEAVTAEVLASADVITPDRAEAAALVGRVDSSRLWPTTAARELHRAGARRPIIKLGDAGAVMFDGTTETTIPTLAIEPRDETGAGDVFLAALAVERSRGTDWADAIAFANAASALSVASTGLTLPSRADVTAARRDLPSPSDPSGPALGAD